MKPEEVLSWMVENEFHTYANRLAHKYFANVKGTEPCDLAQECLILLAYQVSNTWRPELGSMEKLLRNSIYFKLKYLAVRSCQRACAQLVMEEMVEEIIPCLDVEVDAPPIQVFRGLSLRQAEIVSAKLRGYTYEEIAKWFGVSRSRIGQIYKESIQLLQEIRKEEDKLKCDS